MPAPASLELKGAREARAATLKLARDLVGRPVVRAMQTAAGLVTRTARQEAKTDTGQWRNSITPEIVVRDEVVEASVGSNLAHAPFAHDDTKPHWPPLAPIVAWVRRHRLAGRYAVRTRRRLGGRTVRQTEDTQVAYLIARKIAAKGTKGDQALVKGIEQNEARIVRLLDDAIGQVVVDWGE